MWVWIMTAALAGTAAGAAAALQIGRRQRRRELKQLLDLTERIMREKEVTGRAAGEETLYAKIEEHLIRIWRMAKGRRDEAEKSRENLLQLITEIAHQLRNPLSNILNYLELAEGEIGEKDLRAYSYIQTAQEAGQKLQFLTEGFIKMSRLENGVIQIRKEISDIRGTLLNVLGQIQIKAEEKGLEFQVDIPRGLRFQHDPNWLGEALLNILDNAVKYSEERGKVEVTVWQSEMFLKISVRDYGIGIEKGEEGRIFQKFYRGERVTTQEGFGVGLYLARQIILAQGGFIRVKREKKGLNVEIFFSKQNENVPEGTSSDCHEIVRFI